MDVMPAQSHGATAALPFPDADLLHIVELLPRAERERHARMREFLQGTVRPESIG